VSRRRSPKRHRPEQLALVAPVKRRELDPEQSAKVAVARRAKPSSGPDHVQLMLTLDLGRALAERLTAKAIRDGKNLEGIVIELLEGGAQ
jgi:hypothetical protein